VFGYVCHSLSAWFIIVTLDCIHTIFICMYVYMYIYVCICMCLYVYLSVCVQNVLSAVGERRKIIKTIVNRKKNWIGHILRGDELF